jgi:tRNA nucleotidyltransferase (CCA-adding enzyme)
VEITPYRLETGYKDKRHPDKVSFSSNIDDDLKRRDFTINAMAYDLDKGQLKDNFDGVKDLEAGLIRAVGDPNDRFNEDALRMLRAIRFSSELGFMIEQNTAEVISKNSDLMEHVSRERVGEELTKLIMSDNPSLGLALSEKTNILSHILPVFTESIGVEQNKEAHKYDVWEHSLRTLQHAADKKFSLEVRLAALFHDVSKPETKQITKGVTTFYNHDVVGAKVARETLRNLAFSKETVQMVYKLVRYHMFFSDTDQITHSAVRRLIQKVGKESIWDLIDLRKCDRIGSGRPKEEPYRLRKFQAMIEEVIRDPISVSMLKIDGNYLMEKFHVEPGPKIGWILHALLEDVLENPQNNTEEFLVKRTEELLTLSDTELQKLGEQGKDLKDSKEDEEVSKIRKGRFVE